MDGDVSSLSTAPVDPSLEGDEAHAREEDIKDTTVTRAEPRADDEGPALP